MGVGDLREGFRPVDGRAKGQLASNIMKYDLPDRHFCAGALRCLAVLLALILTAGSASSTCTLSPLRSCTVNQASGIFVSNDVAYLTSGASATLNIVALPSPPAALTAASLGISNPSWDVFVSGFRAYLTQGDLGIEIVNSATGAHSGYCTNWDPSLFAIGIYASGSYAYVGATDGTNGKLVVLSLTNPDSPSVVNTVTTASSISSAGGGLCVSGNNIYLATDNGIDVYDISNPTNPSFSQALSVSGGPYDVHVFNNKAYIAVPSGSPSIQVRDLSNWGTIENCYNDADAPYAVQFYGGKIYVADTVGMKELSLGTGSMTVAVHANVQTAQTFSFNGDLGSFILDDNSDPAYSSSKSFMSMASGDYIIHQTVPSGWLLSSISATDPSKVVYSSDGSSWHANWAAGDTYAKATVSPGGSLTVTFAEARLCSISGHVIYDLDGSGTKNNNESYVPDGWKLELWKDGTKTAQTTTLNGAYAFNNLASGNYEVRSILAAGWSHTLPSTGSRSYPGLFSDQADQNFGAQGNLSLSGTVFYDWNGNGAIETGEEALAGKTVQLVNTSSNSAIAESVSGADGSYQFRNIALGGYSVRAVPPAYWVATNSPILLPALSASVSAKNLGLRGTLTINGNKFYDRNANGVQDSGEESLGDWHIFIDSNKDGIKQDSEPETMTALSIGSYSLSFIAPGSYTIREVQQSGYVQVAPSAGYYDVIVTNADVYGKNFSNTKMASISGMVWDDANDNGLQDPGESGLAGIGLELLDSSGGSFSPPKTAVTDGSGGYSFSILPGSYAVKFTLPSGRLFSPKDQGGDDTADSDADPISGRTDAITVSAEESSMHWDAGMYENRAVINEIYPNPVGADNAAGTASWERVEIKNIGSVECNVGSWTIKDDDSPFILATIPAGTVIPAGGYLVVHLQGASGGGISNSNGDPVILCNSAGIEVTRIACPASSSKEGLSYSSLPDASSNWNFWGDPTFGGSLSSDTLPGAPNMGMDYGDAPDSFNTTRAMDGARHFLTGPCLGASVDGELDGQPGAMADGDGADDDGATFSDLIAGLPAELNVTSSGQGLLQAWMDFNGDGDFSDAGEQIAADQHLSAGMQTISFNVPAGAKAGFSYARLRLSSSQGLIYSGPAPDGEVEDYRVEILSACYLGDLVWMDLNGNGLQDPGEPGLEGVKVNLRDLADSIVSSKTTAADGGYLFVNPSPGTYFLEFLPPAGYNFTLKDAGSDDSLDSDAFPASHRTGPITVTAGGSNLTLDAGLYQPASIAGMKFNDKNASGSRDPGEPGLGGWRIYLDLDDDGVWNQTGEPSILTDSAGLYSFSGIAPAVYRVREIMQSGWVQSCPSASAYNETILSGQAATDRDFGNHVRSGLFISGQKRNETGAAKPGWSISLTGTTLEGQAVSKQAVTGSDGRYNFTDLQAGNYTVSEENRAGWVNVSSSLQAFDLRASQANADFVNRLVSGLSISGAVFWDKNGNSVRDAAEPGLSGWKVRLLLGTTEVASNLTEPDGNYSLPGLDERTYTLILEQQGGWVQTLPPAGGPFNVTVVNVNVHDLRFGVHKTTVVVNPDGTKDYTTIAAALANVMNGDTIIVQGGTYPGFQVGKDGISLIGEGSPSVAGVSFGDQNDCRIEGFNIAGGASGIDIAAGSGNIITGNTISGGLGLFINVGSGNIITGNTISGTNGIFINSGRGNTINDNIISGNNAFVIDSSRDNTITGNTISGTNGIQIGSLDSAFNNTITRNTISCTNMGILMNSGSGNTIYLNCVKGNSNRLLNGNTYTTISGDYDYNGRNFTSRPRGSYWSAYTGTDDNFDGIGDFAYGTDTAPIMNTFAGWAFEDKDGDGVRDAGESGMGGLTVSLSNGLTTITSNAAGAVGEYSFRNLPPGSYIVNMTAPAGYFNTTAASYSGTIDCTGVFHDFGLQSQFFISGQKRNEVGAPISGWGINLTGSGLSNNTTTAADGRYNFTGLLAGHYTISEEDRAGWVPVGQASQSFDLTDSQTNADFVNRLASGLFISGQKRNETGAAKPGWSISLNGTTLIGEAVSKQAVTGSDGRYNFTDLLAGHYIVSEEDRAGWVPVGQASQAFDLTASQANADFVNRLASGLFISGQKRNETGAAKPGWSISLTGTTLDGEAVSRQTSTGSDGRYNFTDLQAGHYTVSEEDRAGWVPVGQASQSFNLTASQANTDFVNRLAAGLFISGQVITDAGDPEVGWTLYLSGFTLEGEIVSSQALTASDGSYNFTDLKAGSYTVSSEFRPDWPVIDPISGSHSLDLYNSGSPDRDFIVGLRASIMGCKFEDKDGDGQQEAGEPGLEGWTVRLHRPDGTEITATTIANGSYAFPDLPAGSYTLDEVFQDGWQQTAPQGGNYSVTLVDTSAKGFDFGNRRIVNGMNVTMTIDPALVLQGDMVRLTSTVMGQGAILPETLNAVQSLPKGLKFVSATPPPQNATENTDGTTTITWTGLAVGSNPLAELVVQATAKPDALGEYISQIRVNGTSSQAIIGPASAQASLQVVNQIQPVSLNKSADLDVVWQGGYVTYTIAYQSNVDMDISGVVITEQAPETLQFVSATPSPDSGTEDTWSIGILPGHVSSEIKILYRVKERANLTFTSQSRVEGSGFVNARRSLCTETRVSITNSVTLSCNQFPPVSATHTVKLQDGEGADLLEKEHGSGELQSEEEMVMKMENQSIRTAGSLVAEYHPSSFSLPGGRQLAYSSLEAASAATRNRDTSASTSQSFRYARSIDLDRSLLLDRNETDLAIEAQVEGQTSLGVTKREGETVKPSPVFESSQDYLGSFRINGSLEDYGGNVRLAGNTSGQGRAASDLRLRESQRSYQHGSGSYEAEEQASTAESFLAKDLNLSHDPSYSNGKWKAGIWSRSSGKSFLGQEISGADYIREETVAGGLSDMSTNMSFSGAARLRAASRPESDSELDLDESYVGEYSISRKVHLGGVSRFDRPHITLTKAGQVVNSTAMADYKITVLNDGNAALGPVYVWDAFPAGTDYLESSLKPDRLDSGYANWTLLYLGIGQAVTIDLRLNLTDPMDSLTNRVYASGGHDDEWVYASNLSTISLGWLGCCPGMLKARMQARINSSDPGVILYRILLHNQHNSSLAAQVTDTLPAGLQFLQASLEPQDDGRTLTWVTEAIAPGGDLVIEYQVRALQEGRYVNTAAVESYPADGSDGGSSQVSATLVVGNQTSYAEDGWRPPEWGLDRSDVFDTIVDSVAGEGADDGDVSCPAGGCPL